MTVKGDEEVIINTLLTGWEEIRQKWGWFLFLGIALIVLGSVALGVPRLTTLTSVLLFGWLIILGGVFEAVAAFAARKWIGFFLHLLSGILSIVVGALMVTHLNAAAGALTLLLAAFFLISGLFRIVAAVMVQFPGWGWAVFGGIVSTFLGILIWVEWPSSALWVIGIFVAIDLLCRGLVWMMFALAARQIP